MSDAPLATDAQTMTIGDTLREARIAAGLTVVDVASKLNLTAQAVESIETHQFERLPGTTFARGYIRSYAKVLGLDADQLAQQFDQLVGSSSLVGVVHSIDQVGEARRVSRGMLQFSVFVIVLIVIGAAYYAWQMFNRVEPEASIKPAVFERVEVERADGSVHVQTLDEPEDQAVAFALEAQTAPETADIETESVNQDDALQAVEPEVAQEEPVQALPPAAEQVESNTVNEPATQPVELAPGVGALEMRFENDCWLRIVDADGNEISSGLKRAGEQLAVTGKAPLDVHLGYARGVSIVYNGEPVDFSSAVRGETARIKLGE